MLIKIGDFARQARVTVKALRHYERLGLLKPAWINRYNGYRFYAPEQREQLDLLLCFKNLGFPLGQVGLLLDARLSDTELRALLAVRMKVLQELIQKEQSRLEQIKMCLEEVDCGEGRAGLERILSIQYNQKVKMKEEIQMEIKTKRIPALKLVGLPYQGKNEHQEIGKLWTIFNGRAKEIKCLAVGETYGVCSMPDGLPEGEFKYLCALPVLEVQAVPDGMEPCTLEEMTVAVFAHRGAADKLGETYTNIYQKWLPEAGLNPLENGFDMEMYNEEFKNFAPDSVMYVYVPIQE